MVRRRFARVLVRAVLVRRGFGSGVLVRDEFGSRTKFGSAQIGWVQCANQIWFGTNRVGTMREPNLVRQHIGE